MQGVGGFSKKDLFSTKIVVEILLLLLYAMIVKAYVSLSTCFMCPQGLSFGCDIIRISHTFYGTLSPIVPSQDSNLRPSMPSLVLGLQCYQLHQLTCHKKASTANASHSG